MKIRQEKYWEEYKDRFEDSRIRMEMVMLDG